MADTRNLEILIKANAAQAQQALSGLSKQVDQLGQSHRGLGSELDRSGLKIDGMTKSIFLGDLAAQAFTKTVGLAAQGLRKVFDIGEFAVKSAADFEQNRVAFETMLGSADKARALLKEVSDFAAATPFVLPEVVAAAQQLLAYGFAQQDVIRTTRMLGDVASGLKIPFGDIVYLYGTMRAQGRAYTRDLIQFTSRGIPVLDLLAKQFHVTTEQIFKMTEEGKVGFKDIEKAFQSMTGPGGQFFNLMTKQSKTFSGTMSNVSDNLGRLAREIVGISDSGDIREGSIFATLIKAATAFYDWTTAHRGEITAFFKGFLDHLIDIGRNVRDVTDFLTKHRQQLEAVAAVVGFVLLPRLAALSVALAVQTVLAVASAAASFYNFVTAGWQAIGMLIIHTAQLGFNIAKWTVLNTVALAHLALSGELTAALVVQRLAMIASATGAGILTAAQWALNFAMTANPIGLIVVALAGLVVWLALSSGRWEEFKNTVVGAIQTVLGWFGRLLEMIGKVPLVQGALKALGSIKIPGLAEGGTVARGGFALVGERGPELVSLPQGSRVFSNSESRRMSGGTGGVNIGTLNVTSEFDLINAFRFIGMQMKYSGH